MTAANDTPDNPTTDLGAATALAEPASPTAPLAPADELVRQLYGLGALRRQLARTAADELGSVGFIALAAVWRLGPARVSDIAADLHIDLSVASRQLASLASAGYVARTQDPDDKRAQLVELTPTGREVLRGTHERMVAQLHHALEGWGDSEVSALAGAIARLIDGFQPDVAASAARNATTATPTPGKDSDAPH